MSHPSEPAFPVPSADWQGCGLTKRELIAAMQRCPDELAMSWGEAMVGPYPSYDEGRRIRYDEAGMRWWAAVEARYRVMYADALLAELERSP